MKSPVGTEMVLLLIVNRLALADVNLLSSSCRRGMGVCLIESFMVLDVKKVVARRVEAILPGLQGLDP